MGNARVENNIKRETVTPAVVGFILVVYKEEEMKENNEKEIRGEEIKKKKAAVLETALSACATEACTCPL